MPKTKLELTRDSRALVEALYGSGVQKLFRAPSFSDIKHCINFDEIEDLVQARLKEEAKQKAERKEKKLNKKAKGFAKVLGIDEVLVEWDEQGDLAYNDSPFSPGYYERFPVDGKMSWSFKGTLSFVYDGDYHEVIIEAFIEQTFDMGDHKARLLRSDPVIDLFIGEKLKASCGVEKIREALLRFVKDNFYHTARKALNKAVLDWM